MKQLPLLRGNEPASFDIQEFAEVVTAADLSPLDGIVRQDADSARAAMRIHLTNSRERLRLAQRLSLSAES